jgi:hypothetical protein
MTQQNPNTPAQPKPVEAGTGEARPDQKLSQKPGQNPPTPSTGGQGAAGAGGPAGFGGAN